jgi:hypothetical protein
MQQPYPLAGLLSLVALGSVLLADVFTGNAAMFHERKEVAGLAVVFGAEPEPALTEEMQSLRWRVSSLADEKPYADFQAATVTISRDGEEYGPFPVRGSRRDPGLYQTRHIFTTPGEYESVLSFRKGEEKEVHTVDFSFRIRDRVSLEIPPRKPAGR